MSALQQIFREHGPAYLEEYGERMPANHKKVLRALMACRDGTFGTHLYECQDCGHVERIACACGNRHCPNCQHQKAAEWLAKQMENLLPCSYFLVTFTVPEEIREFLRSHQEIGYEALFQSASRALKKLAEDKRFVGADQLGFFGVLHTWGRTLIYHPHVHMVVAGGGLSKDRREWMASRADLFVHVRPLSRLYRGKFRQAMKEAGVLKQVDSAVWQKEWVVNSEAVGNGQGALKYLAAYVFRVAISNNRIVSARDGKVTIRYEDSETRQKRKMTLETKEFIRRFLQHVLPKGFMKVRHYGFLSPNARVPLEKIRSLISMLYEVLARMLPPAEAVNKPPLSCPRCGKPLVWMVFVPFRASTTG